MTISMYLVIAIVCAILLAISAFFADFGGHGDLGVDTHVDLHVDSGVDAATGYGDFQGPGISPLSLPIMLVFGTLFGASGTVFEGLSYDFWVVPLLAVVIATIITAIIYIVLVKFFVKTQATTRLNMQALMGREAETTMPVSSKTPGQVMVLTEERGRTLLSATSDADIPTNAIVEIIGVVGNGVKVRMKAGGGRVG